MLSSAAVEHESFYGRFSTSTRERPAPPKEHERFYGRFSTVQPRQMVASEKDGGTWEIFVMLVLAFDLVFGFLRPFVAEPVHVPSESMAPTLQTGDRVLVNKFVYDFTEPEKGDVAVFESLSPRADEDVVKRVVGLPGDEVLLRDGVLRINGEEQDEPYINETREATPGTDSFGPMVVPEDHVFVMGDNRADSYDSRIFGPVPYDNLLGEVTLRFWPPTRLGTP